MTDGALTPGLALATVLVDELIAGGVREAVLCPGSRNGPLSLALHEADAAGRLRLHVRIDERTAGFLALGLARGSGQPVPVATTSGTAVANLHPAVLEAHHGQVPLLVLSADRPPWLRAAGANQVIDQRTVFGTALRFFHEFDVPRREAGQNGRWRSMVCRALFAAVGGDGSGSGPVQLNIALDEPLLPRAGDPDVAEWPEPLAGRGIAWLTMGRGEYLLSSAADPLRGAGVARVPAPMAGKRCLVIDCLGPRDSSYVVGRLATAGHPVVSERGGLAGSGVLENGMHLLADATFREAHRPDRVIVLGRPTLLRSVGALLATEGLTVDVVDTLGRHADVSGRVHGVGHVLDPIDPDRSGAPADWTRAWREANDRAGQAVVETLAGRGIADSPVLARQLIEALPDKAVLALGASQTPRDVALFARSRDNVTVVANRGVSGIDGTLSTAIGVALSRSRRSGRPHNYALMGDLAFLHDVTALAFGRHEPLPDLTVVVANNDGGSIFGTLEAGEPQFAGAHERVFAVPVGADLGAIAAGFGVSHELVTDVEQLREAVRRPPSGIRVVEVPVDRTGLRDLLAEVRDAVGRALAADAAG